MSCTVLAPQCLLLLATPLLLRDLGAERFGLFALGQLLVTLLAVGDLGLGVTLARFLALRRGEGDTAGAVALLRLGRRVAAALGVTAALVVLAATPVWAGHLHAGPDLRRLAADTSPLVAATVGLTLARAAPEAWLMAHDRYRLIAVGSAAGCLSLLAGLVAVHTVASPDLALAAMLAARTGQAGVALVVASVPVALAVRGRRGRRLRRAETAELGRYAVLVQTASVAGYVNSGLDGLLVAALLPLRQLAWYQAGAMLAALVRAVPGWFATPFAPALAAVHGEDGAEAARQRFRDLNRDWLTAATSYLAVLVPLLPGLVVVWLGRPAGAVTVVACTLAAGYGVTLLTTAATCYARAVGRPGLETRYGVVSAAVNVVATAGLGVVLGLPGIVAGTALAGLVGTLYFWRTATAAGLAGRRELMPRFTERPLRLLSTAAPGALASALLVVRPQPTLTGAAVVAASVWASLLLARPVLRPCRTLLARRPVAAPLPTGGD